MSIAKIGIDTGTNTGLAVWDKGRLAAVESMTITKAMDFILDHYPVQAEVKLYIEDARKWIGFNGKTKATDARLQGAGSVKRDASIWEDWCKEKGYEAVFVKPMGKGMKKSAEDFKRITGWKGRTNEHSRDAGMIVYQR
ncbi:hypothetical protein [Psychrobacter sp. BF1]|uniref:hypothetical protein n=1 Tax=Psychrobacter sp. BF1 TaxID=2821147 RepID=UPI001C4DEA5E|nr:hypothetical protein [Psychrobacter sp. BF1]